MNYGNMEKEQLISMLKAARAAETNNKKCSDPDAANAAITAAITNWQQENFVVTFLDAVGGTIITKIITMGILNQSLVHPREVFAPAIELRAAAIIIGHNHPSGDPEPSAEDKAITARLQEAGKLLGIELLDHVVVTATGSYYSFCDSGRL